MFIDKTIITFSVAEVGANSELVNEPRFIMKIWHWNINLILPFWVISIGQLAPSQTSALTPKSDGLWTYGSYLNGVQSQLYHGALLRCESFGFLTNHVLLKTTVTEAHIHKRLSMAHIFRGSCSFWFGALMPGPQHNGGKTYCTFSLDSCPSSLAALKMSWVPWKRQKERRTDGRKVERRKVLLLSWQTWGGSKRLGVTQRTVSDTLIPKQSL